MKIKGEYKIELRDAKTGKVTDTRVGHNFVTDFTQEQFKHYGGRQPQSAYSLDGFFGGIMCFDSAINENTDMSGNHDHPIFAPATKNMTANGCVAYSESSASATELGAYNVGESVTNTGRSRRYVYDWDTNEGNGTIGCVCLTSARGGWKGVGNRISGSSITAQNNKVGYEYSDYDYRGGLLNFPPPYISSWQKTSRVCYVNGNKVGILYQRSDITATSIKVREYDLLRTTRNPFNNNGNYFTYARYEEKTFTLGNYSGDEEVGVGSNTGYWYVVRRSSNQQRNIKVDIFNNDGTQEDYVINVPSSLVSDARNLSGVFNTGLIKKNGYIFFCTGYDYEAGSNFFTWAYNIATTTVSLLYSGAAGGYRHWYRSYLIDLEDVLYNDLVVIKFVNGTPTAYQRNKSSYWNNIGYVLGKFVQDLNNPYDIWMLNNFDGGNQIFEAVGLPDIWLSTIANLSQPVVKTADKTMKITYTLTLQEE